MFSDQIIVYAFGWASWSSVLAGAVAALAIWMVMVVIGIALGFHKIEPRSHHPFDGLGKTFTVWYIVSVVVSLAAGGYIAGLFSAGSGMVHGLLVWAVVVLVSMLFSGSAICAGLRTFGSAVRSLGSGTASVAGMATDAGAGAANAVSNAVSNAVYHLKQNVHMDFDGDKLNHQIMATLRDTGEEKLQPEYISAQLREARSELRRAIHRFSQNPTEADTIVTEFLEAQKNRLTDLADGFDREAAVRAIVAKRNIPESEAETLVDDAICMYQHTLHKVKEGIAEANQQVKDAKHHMMEMADTAREKADDIADMAAKAAAGVAAALIIGALICMGAGWCGSRYTLDHTPLAQVITTFIG